MVSEIDCILISPPSFYEEKENIWTEINSNFPPLGLASIAGYVRSKGFSVKIIDCNINAPSVESFRNYFRENFARKFRSIRIIGITAVTCNVKKAYLIADICKEFYPDSKVVLGGVHPTFNHEEALRHKSVDIVVIGEGELTFEDILKGNEKKDIKGIAYRQGKKIIVTPARERVRDLDSLPMPAYDLMPIHRYKPATGTYKKLPAMAMMTSRGCPGRCTFCSKTLGNMLAFKSAESIYREILYLKEKYGIKQIMFYDDTFTVNRKNVIKLCDMIIQDKLDIAWTCFARVDYIDKEMLGKMKDAGCHQIMYGVENIDGTVLKNINKRIDVQQVIRATKLTKESGIECRLAFMVGNPGDNEEIINKNIEFLKKVNPDLLIVNITTPYPGTEMFKWAKERNLILSYDWDDYNLAKQVMRLDNLEETQIKNLYKKMYRSFYLRPNFVVTKLLRIRSIDDVKILASGAAALFTYLTSSDKKASV